MSILGIGPSLAITGAASAVAVILLKHFFGIELPLIFLPRTILTVAGALFCCIGLIFWIGSALVIERAFKAHQLATGGVYRFSRNPLYAAFIVFIVPGIALILNEFLLLIVSAAMYTIFALRIGAEEEYLKREFGEEYERYANRVKRLIPFIF